ncbi:hypothetical protein [Gordonia humi]|uniref:Uncharacterized protein n=1 Tax=Gordonia humi TaxID=686429 RepID=A0A840EM72_9ACTN|nr:hypothetical protein [Gordonia humi]MBB4133875.1 hypothetical protein [Gordonia humi]
MSELRNIGPPGGVDGLERSVEVGDAEIWFDVRGGGDRTVVLVRGQQAHHGWWRGVMQELSGECRLALLDGYPA